MILTFKYRLYPTQAQESQFNLWLESLCELQNSMRDNRKYAYEEEGRSVSMYDQSRNLLTPARKKYNDIRAVPVVFQEQILRRVDEAFTHFRHRVKEGAKEKGYPRYRKSIRSFAWRLQTQKGKHPQPIIETKYRHNRLKVPKLGQVKIRMHRPLRGVVKMISIVKKASGWYAHIVCDVGETLKYEPTRAVGVDMGTTHYLTTSEGEKVDNPRWYRKAEGLLRKHSKTQSRRKKGSQRWRRSVHAVGLHHERTTNKRKDFIGKLVYKLFHHNQNNVLVAENLKVSNMVQNKHLSKSISDASWSTFFEWCANIAERDGLHFHQVNPRDTSQTCSCCGQKSPKKLSLAVRTFDCGYCGLSLDRDHNAALNILFRAAQALRGERWVTTLIEARSENLSAHWKFKSTEQLVLFDALAAG